MEKKKPMRTCIVCRECSEKKQLLRVVRNKDGEIFLDKTGKADGRGAYVCSSEECIKKLKKGKFLNRAFSMDVSEKVYDSILEDFLGTEK